MSRFVDIVLLEGEAACALESRDREELQAVYSVVQKRRVENIAAVTRAHPGSPELAAAKTRRDRLVRLAIVLRAALDSLRPSDADTLPPPASAEALVESERLLRTISEGLPSRASSRTS